MVAKKTNGPIHKYGVTIGLDGWDNVMDRLLINVMLAYTSGERFLGSINTREKFKDLTYVAT